MNEVTIKIMYDYREKLDIESIVAFQEREKGS